VSRYQLVDYNHFEASDSKITNTHLWDIFVLQVVMS